jgi:single-strand DNA-binding protein
MARSLNKVMLIGNLGKDAETRFTPSGASVSNFSLATSWRSKDQQTGEWKDHTDWHNIVVWRAENITNYLQKGRQVFVEGRLQTRSWEDQNGNKKYTTEVVADNVILLGGRGEDSGGSDDGPSQRRSAPAPRAASAAAPASSADSSGDDYGDQGVTDDDVPF